MYIVLEIVLKIARVKNLICMGPFKVQKEVKSTQKQISCEKSKYAWVKNCEIKGAGHVTAMMLMLIMAVCF